MKSLEKFGPQVVLTAITLCIGSLVTIYVVGPYLTRRVLNAGEQGVDDITRAIANCTWVHDHYHIPMDTCEQIFPIINRSIPVVEFSAKSIIDSYYGTIDKYLIYLILACMTSILLMDKITYGAYEGSRYLYKSWRKPKLTTSANIQSDEHTPLVLEP